MTDRATENSPANEPLLKRLRSSRVLFYPGAGDDISPALRFVHAGMVDTIVYCDYLRTIHSEDKIKHFFEKYAHAMRSPEENLTDVIPLQHGNNPKQLRISSLQKPLASTKH